MRAIDFEYDGQYLSYYGFIICDFDTASGVSILDVGSNISFNKVSMHNGRNFSLVSAKYEDCFTTTFDICKDDNIYDYENMEISNDEFSNLVKWLNRKDFNKFCFLSDDFSSNKNCFFNASFNLQKITIGGKLLGIRLHMETDKPFGYGEEIVKTFNLNSISESNLNTQTVIFNDTSDEIGIKYPTIIIQCEENGDLSIINNTFECETKIKNCSVGEEITLNGDSLIISSNNDSHDICKDFNFEFFIIGNKFDDIKNEITATKPCKITIKYIPIIKNIL